MKYRGKSRGFYSKFAAYRLKSLEEFYWPVHFKCLCLTIFVILRALGYDKCRESYSWTKVKDSNKELGAGLNEWRGGAGIREREQMFKGQTIYQRNGVRKICRRKIIGLYGNAIPKFGSAQTLFPSAT